MTSLSEGAGTSQHLGRSGLSFDTDHPSTGVMQRLGNKQHYSTPYAERLINYGGSPASTSDGQMTNLWTVWFEIDSCLCSNKRPSA